MAEQMLQAPRRKTAADVAETALFQGIMDGRIPPGAPLRLQDLSNQLAMSMMPIREAIRRLQALGLVEVVAHKGAWVRPLTVEDLYDTYFTRIHLEAVALREAAGRGISPELAEGAREAFRDRQDAFARGDLLASRDAHERFHFALYEASGSTWLVHSIWPVWRNSERYRNESMRNPEHRNAREAEHMGMLEAVEAGDAAVAVRLLVQHLATSCDLVAAALAPSEVDSAPRALPTADEFLCR
jgi:DNA-binding GntR family transcriptional regulator